MINREEIAWLAGLIEGEGCFSLRKDKGVNYLTFSISMTDKDVIESAASVFPVGTLGLSHIKQNAKLGKPPLHIWRVQSQKEVYALMIAIYPWLGESRKSKIRELITEHFIETKKEVS